jgi:hypothetical protein
MIYKFKSKAAGDVIMLAPSGDALMRVLGREPAAQGIIEVAAMAQAIDAIQAAIAADEAERAEAESEAQSRGATLPAPQGVTSRQRMWPMVEMLKRAQSANEPIVWGV